MKSLFLPQFRSTSFAAGGLKAIVHLWKNFDFRAEGYIFQPYREIIEDPNNHSAMFGPVLSDRAYILAGTLVYNTFLGPISAGVTFYDKLREPFTFNLNFGYNIFNPKPLP